MKYHTTEWDSADALDDQYKLECGRRSWMEGGDVLLVDPAVLTVEVLFNL